MTLDWLPTGQQPLGAAAEAYAAHGWPVLPLAEHGKVPASSHGLRDATTDVVSVREMWRRRQGANIGVRIPDGLVVVDVDGPDGVHALRGRVPRTLTAATNRGWHLWYRAPQGVQLRQGAAFLPGVDSRAPGRGYVVAPPSVHQGGTVYEWARRMPPAPLPDWLVELLRCPAPAARETFAPPLEPTDLSRRERYAWRAMEGECAAVAGTPQGGRNHRLVRAWLRLARDLADVLPRDTVRSELTRAALAAGLPEIEVRRVLRDDLAMRGAA